MDYQSFVYDYVFLFLYVYSFVLISMFDSAYIGWWSLTLTQLLGTAYFLSTAFFRILEPTFHILAIAFILTLVSLIILVNKLTKFNRQDPSVNYDKKILSVPLSKQELLWKINQFVISIVSLMFFVLVFFKMGSSKYMFPFYIKRRTEYAFAPIQMIQYNQYTYFVEYMIPWLCGMSQMAILGMTGYLVFLTNDF